MRRPGSSSAVLLLAYGGPASLDDVPAYVRHIRGGRETPQHLIDEVTQRYRLIGGHSPLLATTRRVAAKLNDRMGRATYVGMRHWHPFIDETVAEMAADGVTHAHVICMAPHYSELSIGAYRASLDKALRALPVASGKGPFAVTFVESWNEQPEYLDGVSNNVRQALRRFPKEVQPSVRVVFTAHSLPVSILERGDPYDDQLNTTARLLAERLGLAAGQWSFCYQSASRTGSPWLGPQIEDVTTELAARGERHLVVAPIGFVADHVETLYDLDIALQARARELGVRIERAPMLNDDDALIAALTSLVCEPQPATAIAQCEAGR